MAVVYVTNNTDPKMEIHPLVHGYWRVALGFVTGYGSSGDWFPKLREAKSWAASEYKHYRRKQNPPKRITWSELPEIGGE